MLKPFAPRNRTRKLRATYRGGGLWLASGRIDGLRPVDCGPLEMARITEQLTALIIAINVRNKARAGIKITGL